jgi:hypothetical protein
MVKPASHIPEEMVRLAHALVESETLRSWFLALEALPASLRSVSLSNMAAQMRKEEEDPGLTSAVAALVHPKMYESVLEAVRERCR